MRRALKWLGIILGVVGMLVILAATGVFLVSRQALNETYEVRVETLIIPDGEDAIARGEYLVMAVAGCWRCHGEDLSGEKFIDNSAVMVVHAPNLTGGSGGIGADYSDEDWVRAIRHGLDAENRSLFLMPSADYHHFTDEDLAATIAYLKSLPPVDNAVEEVRLGPIGYVLVVMNSDFLPASQIDHDTETPAQIEPGINATYGEYLASIACMSCHGENLAGGDPVRPGAPEPPDLTPGGVINGYGVDTFTTFLRTGMTFASYQVDKDDMPWDVFQHLTDEDIEAIYSYILSLP
ncbi:MAG: cytochrome c [Chloroflexi bacterium]|nr:cytochrome c [Chloroflexota bacterium]